MKSINILSILIISLVSNISIGQNTEDKSPDYLKMRWGYVATQMPPEWYGSDEAKLVGENVLIAQKEIGGWEKNKPYHLNLSDSEKEQYLKTKSEIGATFDNGSTITELKFLAKVYSQTHDAKYKQAFEKGLNYIFIAQYENGGWPQYYPVKDSPNEILSDNTKPYSMHITFNDDAMVNIMNFLKDIYLDNLEYSSLQIDSNQKDKAKKTFDKGVECILKTQILINNKPTVWCAQHDEKTLAPANARSYELKSFSGSESVGIVLLLMNIDNPSKEIKDAVNGAVKWFGKNKIEGIKIDTEIDKDGKRNRIVVEDKNALPLWGRFHDLKTSKPFFCSRDGIKKNSLAEISYERRNGYSWYTNAPEKVLAKYPEWKKRISAK